MTSAGTTQAVERGAPRGGLVAGAAAATVAGAATLLDITIGSLTGADPGVLPRTAVERFEELGSSSLLGLYHLDFLNALVQVVTIPIYVAVRAAHLGRGRATAGLATALFLVAAAVFLSTNAALPMLQLARGYEAASSPDARAALTAAGEALLARGAHGTLGALPAFSLTVVAGLTLSVAMLQGRVFLRAAGWTGLLGNLLLLAYLIVVTFVPGAGRSSIALAMPGGLLALAWMVLVAHGLVRLSRNH